MSTEYAELRRETAELLGYDFGKLTPQASIKLDLVTSLRLLIDDMTAKLAAGGQIDTAKLLEASATL